MKIRKQSMKEPRRTITRRVFMTGAAKASAAFVFGQQYVLAGPAGSRDAGHNRGSRTAERRPNVVFILTDDQRWDLLGCEGHPFLKTPNLDRLAAEGARFANMFVTTSLCSPSRASFLSGLYAHSHGVLNNFTDYPVDLPSFPRLLQAAGYETAYIGKWHMGEQSDEKRPGFDYWASHKGQGKYYDTEFNINGRRMIKKGYYTHRVTDMAIDWLQRKHNKPFLLILGHKASHTPFTPEAKYRHIYDDIKIEYPKTAFALQGKPEWVKQRIDTWHGIYGPLYGFRKEFPDSSRESVRHFAEFVRAYTATIKSVDDSVGRIYQALQRTGKLDNTLFIFAGDNGMFLGEHGMTDKRTMHEPSIRVPLLVRLPRLIRPRTVIHQMVLNIDLAPSILDICSAPALDNVHGMSFAPLLEGKTGGWRRSWYYEYNYERQFPYTPNVRGVRTDEWKYVHYPHGDGGPDRHKAELYNLSKDPGETRNLIDEPAYATKVTELRAELERLMKETRALPDKMPIDEGVKSELPEESIR
jgi:arylsulfatase A-like enzyme